MVAPQVDRRTILNLEAALTPYINQIDAEVKKYLTPREPKELYEAVNHLFTARGKHLRPILTLLSAQAVGGDSHEVLPYAAAIEMVHVFSLIHDDIMDKADTRRGIEAVHKKFGQSTALLAGDLLLGLAFETVTRLNTTPELHREIIRDFSGLVKEICEGQQYDLRFESLKKVDELTYFHMAERKTGTLYEVGMKHGALIARAEATQAKKLAEAGRLIGLAFQVWDDVLDLTIDSKSTGKPALGDVFNGKKTLVTVYAMEKLDPLDRRKLIDLLSKPEKAPSDVAEVLKLFDKSGAIKLAKEKAKAFVSHAKSALGSMPPSNARNLITEIADFAVSRDK